MTHTIYMIKNNVNDKVYVGQTTRKLNKRLREHSYKKSGCTKLKRAINKYGIDNFTIENIASCDNELTANALEKFWIECYDSVDNGYNIAKYSGGHFFLGRHHTEEAKKKMSLASSINLKGNTYGSARKGIKLSDQHKKSLSESAIKTIRKGIDSAKLKGKTWKIINGKRIWMEKE